MGWRSRAFGARLPQGLPGHPFLFRAGACSGEGHVLMAIISSPLRLPPFSPGKVQEEAPPRRKGEAPKNMCEDPSFWGLKESRGW